MGETRYAKYSSDSIRLLSSVVQQDLVAELFHRRVQAHLPAAISATYRRLLNKPDTGQCSYSLCSGS